MDKTDEKILSIMRNDARMPFSRIAREIGISEPAIRKRVLNLISRKEARFRVEIEHQFSAILFGGVETKIPTSQVTDRIKRIPEVEWSYEISGDHDFICKISSQTIGKINECVERIRQTAGVIDTSTVFILKK